VLSLKISSQNYIDLFKADFSSTPQNKFDSTNTSTSLTEINGDLTIPFPIKDNLAIISGLTYEMTTASFNPKRSKESLVGLRPKLGANIKHSDKWSGTYLLLPKISNDFKNTSNQDFQIGAAVLMKYAKSDHFNYRLGLYANSELFGPFIVPIFGFYYLNSIEKFEAKVLLPLLVDLNYAITDNTKLGLNF
tara:strand:+ start:596 stop:1168 length:573 start_codon:yes stop_codon:yes gene_type:complete